MTIYIVTQHYPPDPTSTAGYMADIADGLAAIGDVVVLSGTSRGEADACGNPKVVVIPSRVPPKRALVRRAAAMALFGTRLMLVLLKRIRRHDVVLVVTAPFVMPYFVALAARIRRSYCILVLYDVYPETLVRTGIIGERAISARAFRVMNYFLYLSLDAIVTIGRDMTALVSSDRRVNSRKIHLIPNWATLPEGIRPFDPRNVLRPRGRDTLVVGLSGNLGFTHDPRTVFEAAKLLRMHDHVHFMISGWGVGWDKVRAWQNEAHLPNVSLMEPVTDADLESFLAAADAWIIPYLPNLAGVSVPSRLYNLLAVGRPVIGLTEPGSELSLIIDEGDVGWTSPPGNPEALADLLLRLSDDKSAVERKGHGGVRLVVERYTRGRSIESYRTLVRRIAGSTR